MPVPQCPPESQGEVEGTGGSQSSDPCGVGSIHVGDPDLPGGPGPFGQTPWVPEDGPGPGEHRLRLGDGPDGPVEEELAGDLGWMQSSGKDERGEQANGTQADVYRIFLNRKIPAVNLAEPEGDRNGTIWVHPWRGVLGAVHCPLAAHVLAGNFSATYGVKQPNPKAFIDPVFDRMGARCNLGGGPFFV